MEERFSIVPIVAVILKQGSNSGVKGILIPFWRASLDLTFELAFSHQSDTFIIMVQFAELVRGVQELAGVGVQHGDINDRNVLYFSSLMHQSMESRTAWSWSTLLRWQVSGGKDCRILRTYNECF
jgi:hypothetical protein